MTLSVSPKSFKLDFDAESRVATITLDRPDRLNALTFEIYKELGETFRSLHHETAVRAIVITGAGRAFCSGGDVEDIIGALFERDFQGLLEFTELTCELIAAMRECQKPIVAALNGTVAGAGAVIAAASDIRIASDKAKIAFLFVKVGLSGADMGIAWLLPKLIGFGRATELLMTGDFVSPEDALRIGLYNRVVGVNVVLSEAQAFAAKLAKGPAFGLRMTKHLLNREADMDLKTALQTEAEAQAVCMQHPDFREAYEAFTQKREARFR
ncbi:MAG: enoyl-CoA hydratase family protein [Polyangiaceae bacterium]